MISKTSLPYLKSTKPKEYSIQNGKPDLKVSKYLKKSSLPDILQRAGEIAIESYQKEIGISSFPQIELMTGVSSQGIFSGITCKGNELSRHQTIYGIKPQGSEVALVKPTPQLLKWIGENGYDVHTHPQDIGPSLGDCAYWCANGGGAAMVITPARTYFVTNDFLREAKEEISKCSEHSKDFLDGLEQLKKDSLNWAIWSIDTNPVKQFIDISLQSYKQRKDERVRSQLSEVINYFKWCYHRARNENNNFRKVIEKLGKDILNDGVSYAIMSSYSFKWNVKERLIEKK